MRRPIEHASVLETARELRAPRRPASAGCRSIRTAASIRGKSRRRSRRDTRLVSVGWANNEIGTVQAVGEIAAVCRRRGVLLSLSTRCRLSARSRSARRESICCSLAAHKLGGPQGIGALLVRRGVHLRPLLFGGHQERGIRPAPRTSSRRPVSPPRPAAPPPRRPGRIRCASACARGLAALGGCRRYSPQDACLPNTVYVGFAGVRGEALVAALDLEGIAVSVGSACAAGSGEPSHVLRAIGCDAETARGGVRFSTGRTTSRADIDTTLAAVRHVVERMRATAAA